MEIIFDVLALLTGQGLPKTRITRGANITFGVLGEILFGLFEKDLIASEVRETSFDGLNRETEWFYLTPEGHDVIEDFKSLKSRLS